MPEDTDHVESRTMFHEAPSWACVAKCSLILESFGLQTNPGVGTVEKRKNGETEISKDNNCEVSLNSYLILL